MRLNDQINPKDGEQYTFDSLSKLSLDELIRLERKLKMKLKQRGSVKPITHAKQHLDHKKNEREYLNIIKSVISSKQKNESKILRYADFIKENKVDKSLEDTVLSFFKSEGFDINDKRLYDGYKGGDDKYEYSIIRFLPSFDEWSSEMKEDVKNAVDKLNTLLPDNNIEILRFDDSEIEDDRKYPPMLSIKFN